MHEFLYSCLSGSRNDGPAEAAHEFEVFLHAEKLKGGREEKNQKPRPEPAKGGERGEREEVLEHASLRFTSHESSALCESPRKTQKRESKHAVREGTRGHMIMHERRCGENQKVFTSEAGLSEKEEGVPAATALLQEVLVGDMHE